MRNDWETPPTVEGVIVRAWIGEDGQPDVVHVQGVDVADDIGNLNRVIGVVCGRGRNPTLRLWPTIFSGKIDVFPGDRRSRLISSMTSVAPA